MTLRYLKRSIILLLCLAMDFPFAIAQDTFLKLPAFENVSGVSWCDSIYRFPVFEKGKIIYTSNFELDHILNLN
ncbi:hypothetical protein [Chryseolinea sp. H1M3-3]|uniref:hypothetical protein n=1 Tax=Chryseolinea sp. H1M3-3 TaxID=3034144 RepID=UPI0023EAAB2B|nr:hypothetical protein [Chryseolinea sp. H1M3-3]